MDVPRHWIAAALAHAPGISLQPVPDTSALLVRARDEGVLALLYDKLAGDALAALPLDLAAGLRAAARTAAALELARSIEIRRVADMLATAGIQMLILKGGALAYWLYASPSHRPRCDLDLLVESREAAQRAVAVLQDDGYAVVADIGVESCAKFEITLQRRSPGGLVHSIDLHWRLLNHASLSRGFTFGELWAGRIPIPKLHAHAFGLARVHALVHALLHRVTNFPSGTQDRLIWLNDFHLLAGGCSAAEWESALALCADKRIASPCLDGLRASRIAFGTKMPEVVELALQEMTRNEVWQLGSALDQGAMDRAHLAALSWPDRAGWLWRILFPSPAFMRYRYSTTGNAGLARAYLVRWWVGIRRGLGWH